MVLSAKHGFNRKPHCNGILVKGTATADEKIGLKGLVKAP
jgi:hypothetical protein